MASEVLKVSHTAGVTNSESVLLNGVDGHTYTILSISICETAGAAETVDLYIDDGGSGTDYEILSDQAVGVLMKLLYSMTNSLLKMKIIYVQLLHHQQILISL